MKTKEQFLHFFINNNVKLSRHDYNFLSNLYSMIHAKKRITTNQNALFDKLTEKYKKQLVQAGYLFDNHDNLNWKCEVVSSSSEYTGARVYLMGDGKDLKIHLKVPFNKKFVHASQHLISWDYSEKMYISPFSTEVLKFLYTTLPKFFKSCSYSPELQQAILKVEEMSAPIWNPTVVESNGVYYVGALNEALYPYLPDRIDLSPTGVMKLAHLGIKVSSDIELDTIANCSTTLVSIVPEHSVQLIVDWLNAMSIKQLWWNETSLKLSQPYDSSKLLQSIKDSGIEVVKILSSYRLDPSVEKTNEKTRVVIQSFTPASPRKHTSIVLESMKWDKIFALQNIQNVEHRP